jgi:hypothetical protein
MSETVEQRVQVVLHAQLRYYNDGEEETTLPFAVGSTIADYIARLPIPQHEFMGVVLDGTLTGDLTLVPVAGARIELVPAMSGG